MLNRLYDSYQQMSAVLKIKMRKERERDDEQTRSNKTGHKKTNARWWKNKNRPKKLHP